MAGKAAVVAVDRFVSDRDIRARVVVAAETELVARLDEQRLEGAVGEYLEREQINAIMARRDAILEHFSELIRTLGEANVLYGVPGPSARTSQRVA